MPDLAVQPEPEDMFDSYAQLAQSLLRDAEGVCLLDARLASRGHAASMRPDSIAKWLRITEHWLINVGTQNGTTLFQTPRQWHDFTYAQGFVRINEYLNLSAGSFYVNRALATINQPIGASVGIDINFIPGTLWTECDFLSGNTNISGSVVNLFWRPIKPVSLYVGVQVPAAQSGNEFAGNIGIALQD